MEISKTSDNEEQLVLKGRRIALGITGSIASYKAADIASQLRSLGAIVEVLFTKEATRFITPLTLHALTCLLYTSPSPRDATLSRMPSSA